MAPNLKPIFGPNFGSMVWPQTVSIWSPFLGPFLLEAVATRGGRVHEKKRIFGWKNDPKMGVIFWTPFWGHA